MLNWWRAIVLGIVQGLTEFIPVSSSGHLIIMSDLIGAGHGDHLLFDLLVHVATLAAIVLVFYKDILKLFKPPFKLIGFIALASVPAIIGGILLWRFSGVFALFRQPTYLWIFFLLTAILLFATELIEKRQTPRQFFIQSGRSIKKLFTRKKRAPETAVLDNVTPNGSLLADSGANGNDTVGDGSSAGTVNESAPAPNNQFLGDLKMKNVVAMGLMQGAALFPGLSRSGSTIFGGVVTRGKRETVAKFSFLMSIPIILGATIMEEVIGMISPGAGAAPPVSNEWYIYLLGMVFAFAVGFFAIKFMMRLIVRADFKWFSLYLLGVSIFCFVYYFLPAMR